MRLAPVAFLFFATLAGCGGTYADNDVAGKSIRYQVEYRSALESGTAHRALMVSYSSNDGTQERQNVDLPWTTAVGTAPPGFTASVTAQLYGYGTITCRIVADNKVIQERVSAQEPYPKVECRV